MYTHFYMYMYSTPLAMRPAEEQSRELAATTTRHNVPWIIPEGGERPLGSHREFLMLICDLYDVDVIWTPQRLRHGGVGQVSRRHWPLATE